MLTNRKGKTLKGGGDWGKPERGQYVQTREKERAYKFWTTRDSGVSRGTEKTKSGGAGRGFVGKDPWGCEKKEKKVLAEGPFGGRLLGGLERREGMFSPV